jgi:hypothetical protein
MKQCNLVVVALLAQLLVHQPSSAQSLEVNRSLAIDLEWSTGQDGSDVYLDEPRIALLASDGSAYLVEKPRTSLRRFDHAGNELKPLGFAGSGPGEFSRIVSMIDVAYDSLFVYDTVNGQISVFSDHGEFVRSLPAGPFGGKALDLLHVNALTMEWVTAYQPASLWVEPESLIHLYSQDQDEITASAIHPRQIADLDNPLHAFRANSSGAFRSARVQSDTPKPFVVIVPDLYSGQVTAVPIEKNGFGLIEHMTVSSGFEPDPGFVIDSPSQAPRGIKARVLTLHLAGIGKQSAVVQVWNTQVVPMPNGQFGVAFAHAVDQPEETYVDLFTVDEGFLERVRLDLDPEIGNNIRVWDADNSGRLLISYVDQKGNPVLAKTTPLEL